MFLLQSKSTRDQVNYVCFDLDMHMLRELATGHTATDERELMSVQAGR
jgi:hypothetical protein